MMVGQPRCWAGNFFAGDAMYDIAVGATSLLHGAKPTLWSSSGDFRGVSGGLLLPAMSVSLNTVQLLLESERQSAAFLQSSGGSSGILTALGTTASTTSRLLSSMMFGTSRYKGGQGGCELRENRRSYCRCSKHSGGVGG